MLLSVDEAVGALLDRLAELGIEDNLFPVESYEMVRNRRWKYVGYHNGVEELYDLIEDPYELTNRAGDPQLAEIIEALRLRRDELLAE